MSLKYVPAGFVSTNLGLLDKIYLSKITLRSLKAEDMRGVILAASFFVSRYSCNFDGSKLNYFSSGFLDIRGYSYGSEISASKPIDSSIG